jgi:hypothetical protein
MNTNTDIEIIATAIAEFYKTPAIKTHKGSYSMESDSKYKQIPENVAFLSGYTNLNIQLRKAADYYSARKIEPTKTELKEVADLKKDIPILSNKLSKLEKLVVNSENQETIGEYNAIKLKHDTSLKRLGELTQKRETNANAEKLAIISKAFKILCNNKNQKQATTLHSLINSKLNKTTVPAKVEEEYESDDEPVFIPKSNNKFNMFGKQKEYTQPPVVQSSSTPSNIEELIKKYQNGNYLIPAVKKLVEEELNKRKADEKKVVNDFPSLPKTSQPTPAKNFVKSYMDIINTPQNSPVIKTEVVIETVSSTEKKKPALVLLTDTMPKYTMISKEDLGYLTRCTYEYTDKDNKIRTDTFLSPNQKFHDAMHRQTLYYRYINEKQYKPWVKCMNFEEWLEWQDEIEEIEKRDRAEELDLDYESEDNYCNQDDEDDYEDESEFEFEKKSQNNRSKYVESEFF